MKKVLFILIVFLTFISNVNALKMNYIYIDGKQCNNDSNIETCLNGETYSYDSENKILTLNNYNGGRVSIYSVSNTTEEDDITVHLKGNNTITETSSIIYAFASGIPLNITADENASLTINGNYQNTQYMSVALSGDKSITIEGGNINVNLLVDVESDTGVAAAGINALEGLKIKGNANVAINIDTDYNYVTGIRIGTSGLDNPPLHIEKNAKLKIEYTVRNKLNKTSVTMSSYSSSYGTPDLKIEGSVEEPNNIEKIMIDNKTCLNDSKIEECLNQETYSWNSKNNILTLNNYESGKVYITSSGTTIKEPSPVKIHLKGDNIITEKSAYYALHSDYDTEITAEQNASLIVNYSNQTTKQNQAVSIKRLLTISGGNIIINNNYNYENDKQISTFNISAYHGVIIKNNANVTLNALNDYSYAVGIIVGGTNIENPPIHVEENAKLNIDLRVKNKLKASSLTRYSYTYYGGTIGKPDIKIDGKVEEYNTIKTIIIDGKTCWNDENIEDCVSAETYSWNSNNNTLTLNNYDSERIYINTIANRLGNDEPVKIHLKGNNTITETSTYSALYSDFNTEITSDEGASLIVNNSNQSTSQHQAICINKLLTISGGRIEFNNDYNYESTKSVNSFVVFAKYGVIIKGNSNVTVSSHTDYSYTRSFVFGGANVENPKLYVEEPATLKIDYKVKNKLNASKISTLVYSVYSGTIGTVDKKITGTVIEEPVIEYIHIDGKNCDNNGKINECFDNETYTWDDETKTITLNNYNSGKIYVSLSLGSMLAKQNKPVTIYLKGQNSITEKSTYLGFFSNGNITIDADKESSLDILYSNQDDYASSAIDVDGILTIQGGNINITNLYDFNAGKDVSIFGIEANEGLIIKDDSNVKINVENNYASVRGIVVGGENIENPKIYIENPSSLEINLATNNILKDKNISLRTYTYYQGTIGEPDIKITGNVIENPSFREIEIDGKKCVNDKNVETCLSSETYSYNKETNTLTLNNYNGKKISIVSLDPNLGNMRPIKVHLIGTNVITNESESDTPFEVQHRLDLEISADENATLTLIRKCLLDSSNVALYIKNGDLTITGGNIIVNNIYERESSPVVTAAGIYLENLILKGKSNLQINVESNYAKAYGIYFMKDKPTITIEKPSELVINAISKNIANSNERMNLPFYLSKNPLDGKVELIYLSEDNSKAEIIAGESKENIKTLKSINEDLSDYQYFKISSEEIDNPKTGENNLIYLLFIMIIMFSLGSIIFINKNTDTKI